MAAEYRTALPDEKALAAEIERTRELLSMRKDLALPPSQNAQADEPARKKPAARRKSGK